MRIARALAVTFMVLTLGIGQTRAAESASGQATHERWWHDAIHTLAAMPDADAQVTAAALAQMEPAERAQMLPLVERAQALEPGSVDIALLAIDMCSATAGCDAETRESRLRPIAPDNAALLMQALHAAIASRDESLVDGVLARLAGTRTFDVRFATLARRFARAFRRLPPFPDESAKPDSPEEKAMALVTAVAIPALQDLFTVCADAPARRQQDCRRIADALVHGDTLISLGIGQRLQLWNARDDADRQAAIEQLRLWAWRRSQLGALAPDGRQLTMLWTHEREPDGVVAILDAAGKPLTPPTDWRDPSWDNR